MMDAFSYLSVLNSIVLGLALASLLAGFAGMIRARSRIKMYWPLPAQMVFLFLLQIQIWWALFALHEIPHWNFAGFIVVVMQPVTVYFATAILVPDIRPGEMLDLRTAYFRETRWYFAVLLLVLIDSVAKNIVLYRRIQSGVDLAGHVAFAILCVAGIVFRRDFAHKMIAPSAVLIFTAYIALLFASMPK